MESSPLYVGDLFAAADGFVFFLSVTAAKRPYTFPLDDELRHIFATQEDDIRIFCSHLAHFGGAPSIKDEISNRVLGMPPTFYGDKITQEEMLLIQRLYNESFSLPEPSEPELQGVVQRRLANLVRAALVVRAAAHTYCTEPDLEPVGDFVSAAVLLVMVMTEDHIGDVSSSKTIVHAMRQFCQLVANPDDTLHIGILKVTQEIKEFLQGVA